MLNFTSSVPTKSTPASLGLCLVTDDSPMVRKIASKMLNGYGYEVDEAENGKIALDKCLMQMPDMVLLDWNMPVMNGLEFLVALRASPGGKKPIVVFCTTESSIDHIRMGIECGADEYIIKPFDRESLATKLEMARRQRG